jgi:hypothetical protein
VGVWGGIIYIYIIHTRRSSKIREAATASAGVETKPGIFLVSQEAISLSRDRTAGPNNKAWALQARELSERGEGGGLVSGSQL